MHFRRAQCARVNFQLVDRAMERGGRECIDRHTYDVLGMMPDEQSSVVGHAGDIRRVRGLL
jgi:hypothetical protein